MDELPFAASSDGEDVASTLADTLLDTAIDTDSDQHEGGEELETRGEGEGGEQQVPEIPEGFGGGDFDLDDPYPDWTRRAREEEFLARERSRSPPLALPVLPVVHADPAVRADPVVPDGPEMSLARLEEIGREMRGGMALFRPHLTGLSRDLLCILYPVSPLRLDTHLPYELNPFLRGGSCSKSSRKPTNTYKNL